MDALTYGLATLAMGQEGFGEPHWNQPKRSLPAVQHFTCKECGATNHVERSETPVHPRKRRRGNNYAHYTRKFSLGNGPSDLVQEYLITKEGGKMLGTLVALAVARMLNLESFAWDMPTGILRDVWLALSSLGERADGEACRLERIWVRWHDNVDDLMLPRATLVNSAFPSSHPPPPAGAITLAGVVPSQMVTGDDGSTPEGHHQSPLSISQNRVERPTFSVLPPLKSLSVLDIDELAYLDEMRVLIGRSQQRLRELRVGIALQAEKRAWVAPPAGEENQWEGVLGTLMRNVYDMRKHMRPESFKNDRAVTLRSACVNVLDGTKLEEAAPGEFSSFGAGHDAKTSEGRDGPGSSGRPADIGDVVEAEQSKMTPEVDDGSESSPLPPRVSTLLNDADYIVSIESHLATSYPISTSDPDSGVLPPDESGRITKVIEDDTRHATIDDRYQALSTEGHLDTVSCASLLRQSPFSGKLALETLELERVPLAAPVVHIAFDWSMITSLTILHCPDHEQLWKSLRRAYAPRRSHTSTTILHSTAPSTPSRRKSTANLSNVGGSEYRMNLKRLHTNAVSPSLINFLKDTLAPNSLEWLFLQEGRPYASSVTMDAIYRGPLKRHKGSLKKLLIDSSDRTRDGRATSNARWRKWIFNREILSFVLGGKMSALRELGMALDYRDWVSMQTGRFLGN